MFVEFKHSQYVIREPATVTVGKREKSAVTMMKMAISWHFLISGRIQKGRVMYRIDSGIRRIPVEQRLGCQDENFRDQRDALGYRGSSIKKSSARRIDESQTFRKLRHLVHNGSLSVTEQMPSDVLPQPKAYSSRSVSAMEGETKCDSCSVNEVEYVGKRYKIIREGLAEILELQKAQPPKGPRSSEEKQQTVFYNPVQQFNRDLSVLAIRAFAADLAAIRHKRTARRNEDLPCKNKNKGKREVVETHEEEKVHSSKRHCLNSAGDRANGIVTESRTVSVPENLSADPAGQEQVPLHKTLEGVETEQAKERGPSDSSSLTNAPLKEEAPHAIGEYPPQPGLNPVAAHPHDSDGNTKVGTFGFRILDALSATGLRALRYAKEIPAVSSVTAIDLSYSAIASIRLNVDHNHLGAKIHEVQGDAKAHMYAVGTSNKTVYHVIDLDPYGTAVPFLDGAFQAISNGGLLCVTCTDSGVLASTGYSEKTFSQYGGLPWKGPQCHEVAIRIVLNAIASSAARYGLAIEPLLSLKIDFYVRIFVRVLRSPANVKFLASKTMVVYNCDQGCGAWSSQYFAHNREKINRQGDSFFTHSLAQAPSASSHCEHCGFKTHLSGPMWGGPLHNPYFIQKILDLLPLLDKKVYGTLPRMEGMLTLALNESLDDIQHGKDTTIVSSDPSASLFTPEPILSIPPSSRDPHPFFFTPANLARALHSSVPSDAAFRGALMRLGYRTTRSHTQPGSIRTDAPWSVIWEVMREWIRQKSPQKHEGPNPGTAGYGILQKDRSHAKLLHAKQELRAALDKAGDVETLTTKVQAALFRIAQAEKTGETQQSSESEQRPVGGRGGKEGLKSPSPKVQDDATAKLSTLDIIFDENLGKKGQGAPNLVRYQMNPRANWGPMSKAKVEP
ncbi:MAG: hypothetical protein Q9214_000426 [Letrouitia sp. 1 TL-2023]